MKEVMLLTGVLGHKDASPEFREELPESPELLRGPTGSQIWCKFVVYSVDEDQVREYDIKGVVGSVNMHEPAFEEHQRVDAIRIADLLVDNGVDLHDFKQIIEAALHTMDGWRSDVVRKADKVHGQLGGIE